MVLADKMRMSESSQNSAAHLWVNLILDQCLQNKAFEIYYKINVLLQFYSDVSLSEKLINNLI